MIAPLLLLLGCPKLGPLPDLDLDKYKPTLRFKTLDIQDIDFDGADVDFVFAINNPNPIDVNLASFSYDLGLAGSSFIKGNDKDGLSLKASKESELRLPVSVVFAELIELRQGLSGLDDVPFALSGNFGFNTPLGVVTLPYEESGEFPLLQRPAINFQQLRLGELKLLQNKASLELDLGVTHEQASPLAFRDFDYQLQLQGVSVAKGVLSQFASVEPGKQQTVTLPIELNLLDAGATLVGLIKDRKPLDVGLTAKVMVDTPYGALPLDVKRSKELALK